MRGWVLPTLAAASVASAACDRGGTPLQVIGGGSSVTITVGSGTTPGYSWSGGGARSLTVQSSSGEVFWQVEALNLQEGFASPVQHGVTPSGARVVIAARTLQPGVVHTATVVSVDGTQGTRTFTPASLTTP